MTDTEKRARELCAKLEISWLVEGSYVEAAMDTHTDAKLREDLDTLRWKLTDKALKHDDGLKRITLDDFHEVWDEHIKGGA